jgi:hypothetical protein
LQSRVDHQGLTAVALGRVPRPICEGLRAAFGAEAPPLSRPARAAVGRVPRPICEG